MIPQLCRGAGLSSERLLVAPELERHQQRAFAAPALELELAADIAGEQAAAGAAQHRALCVFLKSARLARAKPWFFCGFSTPCHVP